MAPGDREGDTSGAYETKIWPGANLPQSLSWFLMNQVGEDHVAGGSVLVLGASGFLGAHLMRHLVTGEGVLGGVRPEVLVMGICRRPERVPEALATRPGCVWQRADLEEDGVAADLVQRIHPSRVFLLAARSGMGACEESPARARHLNGDVPGAVAGACARVGARFVHISTDLVFGGAAPTGGYGEDDTPDAESVYGRTKAEGDARVLAADPSALVVRLPLLLGDSLGRGWGASDGLLAAVARGEVPRLFTDEWRTPLDAAAAAGALGFLSGTRAAGVLHVAGPRRMSRWELGQVVLSARGLPVDAVQPVLRADVSGCADRPADVSLCCERALSLLPAPLPSPEMALGLG